MREKLIELMCEANRTDPETCSWTEYLADYLLQNGVVVLPCKVGEDVYIIENCSCLNEYRTFEECHHRRTKATKWIKCVMVSSRHSNKCKKLFIRPFRIEYLSKIGKTVFLTKEEAEKALERSKAEC